MARCYTAEAVRDAAQAASRPAPEPRPATVAKVSRGACAVTGVAVDDRPMQKPSRAMRIRHGDGEPWRLVIDEELHSSHRTLRRARYAASAAEFGVQP